MLAGGIDGVVLVCALAAFAAAQKDVGVRGGALSSTLRFDGPVLHEGLLGGMMSLDCAVSEEAQQFLAKKVRSGHAAGASSLRWVHRNWDQVIDPWGGDADCHANILLAGLALRHLDRSFIRLGWKFTPRGQEPPSPPKDRFDLTPWDLRPPSIVCRGPPSDCPLSDTSTETNSDSEFNDGTGVEGDEDNLVKDLLEAHNQAVQRWWKARWLLLFADQELASGTWQCWLEGLDLEGWSPGRPRELTRVVLAEMRIFVTSHEPFSWRNTVEAWRVLAVITSPLCYLLFYLLVGIAWAGSNRWRRLLYHAPPTRGRKKQRQETDEELEERRRTWSEGVPKAYNFDPKAYLDDFLTSEGINVSAKRWRKK
nr:unnamed protein product [Spirometra erinaceieuropaei]